MTVKLLIEDHLEFLSLHVIGGCTGSSESTLVKNPTLLEISCRGSYLCENSRPYLTAHKRVRSESIFRLVESEYIEGGHVISHLRNLQIRTYLLRCSVLNGFSRNVNVFGRFWKSIGSASWWKVQYSCALVLHMEKNLNYGYNCITVS